MPNTRSTAGASAQQTHSEDQDTSSGAIPKATAPRATNAPIVPSPPAESLNTEDFSLPHGLTASNAQSEAGQTDNQRDNTVTANPVNNNQNNRQVEDRTLNRGDTARQTPPTIFMKPDTYDGSVGFERYLSHFGNCAELSQWDGRNKVLMLAASLRGDARNYYISLSDADRRDFALLTARLSTRFGSDGKHSCAWLSRFEQRQRAKNESIASLADDIRQLCQKAYADLDHAAQEQLALNQLYKSVPVEMKCRCIDRNCTTVNEAVTIIERYESILGTSTPGSVRVCNEEAAPVSEFASALKMIEARLEKMETRGGQTGPVINSQTQRLCYRCNAPGHFWRNCPQNNRGRNNGRTNTSNRPPWNNGAIGQHENMATLNPANQVHIGHSQTAARQSASNQGN